MTIYPHLFKVDGRHLPGVPGSLHREITDAAMRVGRRTGTTPWFHAPLCTIQYHIGERPMGGPAESLVFQGDRYLKVNVEETCGRIFGARVAKHRKDLAIKQAYDDSATQMKKEMAALNADIRPERLSKARFMLNKQTHGKHSRNQILT